MTKVHVTCDAQSCYQLVLGFFFLYALFWVAYVTSTSDIIKDGTCNRTNKARIKVPNYLTKTALIRSDESDCA